MRFASNKSRWRIPPANFFHFRPLQWNNRDNRTLDRYCRGGLIDKSNQAATTGRYSWSSRVRFSHSPATLERFAETIDRHERVPWDERSPYYYVNHESADEYPATRRGSGSWAGFSERGVCHILPTVTVIGATNRRRERIHRSAPRRWGENYNGRCFSRYRILELRWTPTLRNDVYSRGLRGQNFWGEFVNFPSCPVRKFVFQWESAPVGQKGWVHKLTPKITDNLSVPDCTLGH